MQSRVSNPPTFIFPCRFHTDLQRVLDTMINAHFCIHNHCYQCRVRWRGDRVQGGTRRQAGTPGGGGGGLLTFRGMYQLRNYSPKFLAIENPWIFNVQIYSPLFSEKPKETPFKSTFIEQFLCFITSDHSNVYI